MEFVIEVNSAEAMQKILEADEIIAVKKISAKDCSGKQLRAKRRKTEAKAKNKRRKLGTANGNPYRGKPGDFYRQERLYNNFGMDHIIKEESEKIKAENREFLGKVIKDEQLDEDYATEKILNAPEEKQTLVQCFESGDYELLGLYLENTYPRHKVIEALSALEKLV